MLQKSYEDIVNQYLNDRTGLLIEMGFQYIGNCMCNGCNQKKYKNGSYLFKICDSRGKFTLYRNDQLIENTALTEFITTLQKYEFIQII
jgi:hypothetical protein